MVHKNNKGYKILIYLTAIVLAIFIMIWLDEKNDNPKPEPYKGRIEEMTNCKTRETYEQKFRKLKEDSYANKPERI